MLEHRTVEHKKVTHNFPHGVHLIIAAINSHYRCWICHKFFKKGDTLSYAAVGRAPFQWIHKECEYESTP